jgi:hypothetical protein
MWGGNSNVEEKSEESADDIMSEIESRNASQNVFGEDTPFMTQEQQNQGLAEIAKKFQHISKQDFPEAEVIEQKLASAQNISRANAVENMSIEAEAEMLSMPGQLTAKPTNQTVGRDPFAEINAADEASAVDIANGSSKKPLRIGDKLVALGLISKDQLEVALREQKANNSKKLIGAILVELGFITESALGEILAESAGTKKFDPKTAVLDPDLIRTVPKEVAIRQKVVPVAIEDNKIILAMADVYNVIATDQVRRYFPKSAKIKPIFCSEGDIQDLIEKYYDYETSIDGIIKEIETGIVDKTKLDGQTDNYQNPTVRLVNAFLVDAIHRSHRR